MVKFIIATLFLFIFVVVGGIAYLAYLEDK